MVGGVGGSRRRRNDRGLTSSEVVVVRFNGRLDRGEPSASVLKRLLQKKFDQLSFVLAKQSGIDRKTEEVGALDAEAPYRQVFEADVAHGASDARVPPDVKLS